MIEHATDILVNNPFNLEYTVWLLRRSDRNIWDSWDGTYYRRVLSLQNCSVLIEIRQVGPAMLELVWHSHVDTSENMIMPYVRRLLGINVDLSQFYEIAFKDTLLNNLLRCFEGFRPPRYLSIMEGFINAVSCQQITLTQGLSLVSKLCRTYGDKVELGDIVYYGIPRADQIANADIIFMRSLGYSHTKAQTLVNVAKAVLDQSLDENKMAIMSDTEAILTLTSMRGIGRWSAEYLLLRVFGRFNIFPADDVGGRKNLQNWLNLDSNLTYDSTLTLLEKWKPFQGLLYYLLLLNKLLDSDIINRP